MGELALLKEKYSNQPSNRNSKEFDTFWTELTAESTQIQLSYEHDQFLFLLCGKVINAIIEDIGVRMVTIKQSKENEKI